MRVVCSHLSELEAALIQSGAKETCRGQVWSKNCREWVYFDVALDLARVRETFRLDPSVEVHENRDPRSGLEAGFVCRDCQDAVMGVPTAARQFP